MTPDDIIKNAYDTRRDGDLRTALRLYQQGAEGFRTTAETIKLASAIRHVGDIHRDLGEFDAAERCYNEALSLYRNMQEPPPLDVANCLRPMALMAEDLGKDATALWTQARAFYVKANELYPDLPLQPAYDECDRHLKALGA